MRIDDNEDWHPWNGRRLADGTVEFVIWCDFDIADEGRYLHRSTVWDGTNEHPGPDHSVWMIPSHPTGFEGDDIITGFVRDANGTGMFEEGTSYILVVKLSFDGRSPIVSKRRFTYRRGIFEGE